MKRDWFLKFILAAFGALSLCTTAQSAWVEKESATTIDIGNAASVSDGQAVAYIGSTYYSSIERALSDAASNSSDKNVYVIPGVTTTIEANCTISSGVSLYIPFKGTQWDISSDSDLASLSDGFADTNASNVKNNRSSLVYLANNTSLTISSGGYLYLGGLFRTGGISSSYCEISLGVGSQIINNGTFYCYGYVKENQNAVSTTTAKETMISVGSTGKLYSAMAVYDRKSGSGYTGLPNLGICPISVFDFPNLQTLVDVSYGGIFDAVIRFSLTISGNTHNVNKSLGVIRPYGDSENSIFYLHSGASLSFEYIPVNRLYTSTSTNIRTYMKLSGEATMGYLYVDASYKGVVSFSMIIDTSSYYMPFSYRLNVEFLSGSIFNQNYGIKILPGCEFKINDGATFNSKSDLIVYENDALDEAIGHFVSYPDSSSVDEGKLVNNGTLNVYSTASVGGKILTEKTDDSAIINLQNASSSNLYAQSSEGLIGSETAVDITYFAEGYYLSESDSTSTVLCQFTPGTTIYSLSGGEGVWANDGIKQYEFIFDVGTVDADSTYLFSYTFAVADNTSGTNRIDVVTDSTKASSLRVAEGKSVYAVVSRSISVQLYIDDVSSSLNSNGWYTSNANHDFVITPSKAVSVTTKISGTLDNSFTGSSGSGYTQFDIQESLNSGSSWTTVGSHGSSESTTYVVENSSFRIVVSNGYSSTGSNNLTYNYEATYTIDGNSGGSFSFSCKSGTTGTSSSFKASGSYIFSFNFGTQMCLLPDTLIKISDGSQKPVNEIVSGDYILALNHETGEIEPSMVLFNDAEEEALCEVLYLDFSGKEVGVIYEHGFFDRTLNEYVYITPENYGDYLGHEFAYMGDSGSIESKVLTSAYVKEEYTACYSPVTYSTLNYFTEGMLSMPGGISGLFNYFEYDPDTLAYDAEQKAADIATYGLFTYDDFKDTGLTEDAFNAYNGQYLKVSIGKGLITWDEILYLIERYGKYF